MFAFRKELLGEGGLPDIQILGKRNETEAAESSTGNLSRPPLFLPPWRKLELSR